MIELGANRYGKAQIRVVRVVRGPGAHRLRDLTVAIALEGDFTAAHVDGDNELVVATDTMKNTAYAFAKEHLDGSLEAYGRALADHFLEFEQVDRASVSIREHGWSPIATPNGPAPDAFVRAGSGTRVATVVAALDGTTIEAGVEDLVVMKTARSAFSGFPRDEYTTLRDTDDRIMATKVTAIWRYGSSDLASDALHAAVQATLLEVFADHDSPSVQTSIWLMARAILERHEEVAEVRMALPNLHHWLADLSPFGLDERQRDLHRHDGAARAHRGDRPPRGGLSDVDSRRGSDRRSGPRLGPHPHRRRARVRRRPATTVQAASRGPPAAPPRTRPGDPRRHASARLPARDGGDPRRPSGRSLPPRPTSTTGVSRSPARPSRR